MFEGDKERDIRWDRGEGRDRMGRKMRWRDRLEHEREGVVWDRK